MDNLELFLRTYDTFVRAYKPCLGGILNNVGEKRADNLFAIVLRTAFPDITDQAIVLITKLVKQSL